MNTTNFLAELVLDLSLSDIPEQVLNNARRSFADTLACVLVGSKEPVAVKLAGFVRSNGQGTCSTLGHGHFRTTSTGAAMVNATAAHALDYDDTYSTIAYASPPNDSSELQASGMSVGHLGSCLLPTVLAVGEASRASGEAVLSAYIAGFEAACRISHAIGLLHYRKGYHSTSTLGCMGATAAAGRLMGLSSKQLVAAFAIAASQAAGLRGNFGTMVKPLQAGNAARAAVFSSELAALDFEGPEDILGSSLGFLEVLSLEGGRNSSAIADAPKGGFYLYEGNTIKFLPCANALQGPVESMLSLVAEHDLSADSVAHIDVSLMAPRYRVNTDDGIHYHYPNTGTEGKFILPYCLAAAVLDRKVSLATFTDAMVQRETAKMLFAKVMMTLTPGSKNERLAVHLKNGRKYEAIISRSKGHWSMPFPDDMLEAKFLDCAGTVLSPDTAIDLFAFTNRLETVGDITELVALSNK